MLFVDYLLLEQGRYYAGTMLDGRARFPTIFSMDFKASPRILETSRRNKNWLTGKLGVCRILEILLID